MNRRSWHFLQLLEETRHFCGCGQEKVAKIVPDRHIIDRDILPLFVLRGSEPLDVVSFEGTAFLIADRVLVTCAHCVARPLAAGEAFAVAVKEQSKYTRAYYLSNIEADPTGIDLATANVDLKQHTPLGLGNGDLALGTDVFSFGYPLTDRRRTAEGKSSFNLNSRYLEGYVTQAFRYEPPAGANRVVRARYDGSGRSQREPAFQKGLTPCLWCRLRHRRCGPT